MSNDVIIKKRKTINPQKSEVKVKKEQTEVLTSNVNPSLEEFDWDSYQADCPTNHRKPNERLSTPQGWKVFSREAYAGELLQLMLEHEGRKPSRMTVNVGETYHGTIFSINNQWAMIDIDYREMIYVDMTRETSDIIEQMKPGVEVDVQILQDATTNRRGFILGSVSEGIKTAMFNEIMSTIDEGKTAYIGRVKEMIPAGGYIVNINGIECFMPGSLAGINKLHDFESIVGSDMYVVPISYSDKRGTIVVSHREYLKAMIPNAIEALEKDIEGKRSGMVTGTTKFGVFVEFDECLTGMIHINDLTPEYVTKHKGREIKPGDAIEFYVKEIINNNKIILSQVETVPVVDPWKDIEQRIKTPTEIQGIIKSVKDYGLFVDVEDGVTGLLHISEIEDVIDIKTLKPGDPITVQVTRIESSTRKVFLKL